MAKNKSLVFLGYPDEVVSVEHVSSIDYTVNKIGGKPVRIYYYLSNDTFSVCLPPSV